MNDLEAFNRFLFLRLNGDASSPGWLVQVATGIADYLIYLIPLLLLALWFRGGYGCRKSAIRACLVTLLALGANQAIGFLWPHPRPFMVGLGHTWIAHAPDASFPSDHMTVFAGVGLTLLLDGLSGWGMATFAAGLCVAWARVFLGVHFPLDMAGAVGTAAAAYVILTPLWRRLGGSLTDLAERLYQRVLVAPFAKWHTASSAGERGRNPDTSSGLRSP